MIMGVRYIGIRINGKNIKDRKQEMLNEIRKIPAKISKILSKDNEISEIARYYFPHNNSGCKK